MSCTSGVSWCESAVEIRVGPERVLGTIGAVWIVSPLILWFARSLCTALSTGLDRAKL